MLRLELSSHLETGCYHTDRFDAFLNGNLLVTSNQPIYDGARELLKLGYNPNIMMCAIQNGNEIFKNTIGENAKWTIVESKVTGLQKRLWKPFK